MLADNLNTVPGAPGRWASLRDMLLEVISDIHCGWVQDYLLRPDAHSDARVLSSPGQLEQAFSSTCCASVDPAYTSLGMFFVDLAVPAFTVDDLTVGVSVESYAGDGAPAFYVRRKDRFVHFVHNNVSGTTLQLSVDEGAGIVEMSCFRQESLTTSLYLMVHFESTAFMNAFKSKSGLPDFRKLEHAVMRVVVSDAVHDPIGLTACICRSVCGGVCRRTTGHEAMTNRRKFNELSLIGEWHSKTSLTTYSESIQLFSATVPTNFKRVPSAPSCGVKQMIRWGMSDRLGRLKPTLKYVLRYADEEISAAHQAYTSRRPKKRSERSLVSIAPLPTDPCENQRGTICDDLEKKRQEKIMRRKIRKREAAFKSNEKRKANRLAEGSSVRPNSQALE